MASQLDLRPYAVVEQAQRVRGDHRYVTAGSLFFVPRLIWILLSFGTLLIPSPRAALLTLSAITLAWTIYVVRATGGPYLVPSSAMFLSAGVFVGFAAYYLVTLDAYTPYTELRVTAQIVFALTAVMEMVCSAMSIRYRTEWTVPSVEEDRESEFRAPRQFVFKGLILVAISRIPPLIKLNSELAYAIGLAGIFILVLNSLVLRKRIKWGGDLAVVAVGLLVPVAWVSLAFSGGGRLTVAGLGIAVASLWNLIKPRDRFKVLVLAMMPIFMIAAGLNRADSIKAKYGVEEAGSTIGGGKGLYSVYDPLDRFATIVTNPEYPSGRTIGPRYGATFVNAFMMPIPRSLWKGKPLGFGAEVTQVMDPSLMRIGQSFASLAFGEWYADFGWFGVIAMPFVFGWFLARLDRWHARVSKARFATDDDWWSTVVLMCLVSSLGDLYWGGTFTFYTRGGMAALVTLGMWKLSTARKVSVVGVKPAQRLHRRARLSRP